jgi:hypothetical protein
VHAVIGWLALSAFAEPPRGEVVLGWAGNADHGYGFATVQKALVRGDDAHSSLVLRGTVSQLYYTWTDNGLTHRVDSPGVAIGPAVGYSTTHLSVGAGIGFEARRDGLRIEGGDPDYTVEPDASLSGNIGLRPGSGTAIYSYATFSAVNQNLWARAGAIQQIVPLLARGTKASLWLGPEATVLGGRETRLYELTGVAEVPVRKLHATFSLRGGVSMQREAGRTERQPTGGVGVYWYY